jgi:simple sugar transport system permease protein
MATFWSGGKSYALRGVEDTSVYQVLVGRLPIGDASTYAWYTQISVQSIWAALIVSFLWFILNRHRFGEHLLFIGDSNDVARVVGVDVDREKIKLFTLMGALAAVAAIFLTLEDRNYFGNQGQGYLLLAIASVLIGGTSIFGGKATIVGTVFGAIIIYLMEPGLVAAGATAETVQIMRGLVFLIAVVFYLFMDEPARRKELMGRFTFRSSSGRAHPAGERPAQSKRG